MFKRIKSFIYEVIIHLDFPRYEGQQRTEHERQVKNRFSTVQLQIERGKLLEMIASKANSKFNASILEKENDKKKHEESLKDTDQLLSLFLRHYNEELNALYVKKEVLNSKKKVLYDESSKIKASLSDAFAAKNKAHSKHQNYKHEVELWYAKSKRTPWLMGNSGTKIPKHSLFGQSLGDLDSFKNLRDSAYQDIQATKRKIDILKSDKHKHYLKIEAIKQRIGNILSQIDQVKTDRYTMYGLKKSGYQRKKLQEELNTLKDIIIPLSAEIDNIFKNKKEFINQEKYRLGVIDLESKIRKIKADKANLLQSFDNNEQRQNRKQTHRKIWLKQRGIV